MPQVLKDQRKRVHKGKSERTICRHKRAKALMEAKGFLSLPKFFKWKAEKAEQQDSQEIDAETANGPDESEALTVPQTTADESEAASTTSTASKPTSAAVPMVAVAALEVWPTHLAAANANEASLVAPVFTAVLEDKDKEEDEAILHISRQSSWRASQMIFYESEELTS